MSRITTGMSRITAEMNRVAAPPRPRRTRAPVLRVVAPRSPRRTRARLLHGPASAAAPLHGPAAAAVLLAPSVAWACSGPGAAAQIAESEQIGVQLFGLSLVIGVCAGWHALAPSVSRGLLGSMALLVIVHPGWWMSARGGDCGFTLIEASAVATALIVILAAVLLWRARGRS